MLAVITTIKTEDDRRKAEKIYELYSGTMLHIAISILHKTHLAEDAVSEAFVRIINHLEKIEEPDCDRTRGFVVIIVRNIAYDVLRQNKNHSESELLENVDYTDVKEPVFENISAKEACNEIAQAIDKLPKPYADIIYLKAVYEYSHQQIAALLNISDENVKTRLHRARSALKKILLGEGESNE